MKFLKLLLVLAGLVFATGTVNALVQLLLFRHVTPHTPIAVVVAEGVTITLLGVWWASKLDL